MILRDLLAELRENILNDRSDRVEGSSDYLWTDTTLVRYINEAQRRFAVKAYVIRDSTTSEIVNVTLAEGVTNYTLHPSIIAVVSARREDATGDLARVGHSALGSYSNPGTMMWDPCYDTMSPGTAIAYATDETIGEFDDDSIGAVSLRVYPEPSADQAGDIIKLRVVRKPLDELVVNNLSVSPEIPSDHHLEMLDWAAYLALRIVDHDAGNPGRATEFAASFESHVNEARKLVLRKLFAPRTWGFGRGGFSWGS